MCGDGLQSPVMLYNSKTNRYRYVPVNNKEVYSYGYVTLDKHDGWMDTIVSMSYANDKLNISIYREFQEGSADINLEINTADSKQPRAKVLKYTKRP